MFPQQQKTKFIILLIMVATKTEVVCCYQYNISTVFQHNTKHTSHITFCNVRCVFCVDCRDIYINTSPLTSSPLITPFPSTNHTLFPPTNTTILHLFFSNQLYNSSLFSPFFSTQFHNSSSFSHFPPTNSTILHPFLQPTPQFNSSQLSQLALKPPLLIMLIHVLLSLPMKSLDGYDVMIGHVDKSINYLVNHFL